MQNEDASLLTLLAEIRDLAKRQAELLEGWERRHESQREAFQKERDTYQEYLRRHRWTAALTWIVGLFLVLAAVRFLSWPIPPEPISQVPQFESHIFNMNDPKMREAYERVQSFRAQAREAGRSAETTPAEDSADAR